jgi:hypothetical protein
MAGIFVRLQDNRQIADYGNGTSWDPTDALAIVDLASRAFELWTLIGNEKIVQDYLVSLMIGPRD